MVDLRCAHSNCTPNKFIHPRLLGVQIDSNIGNILVVATTDIKDEEYQLRIDTKCPSCKKFNSLVVK